MVCGMLLTASTGCEKTCDEWFELEDDDCVEMREKFYGTYTGVFSSEGEVPYIGYILLSESADGVQRIKRNPRALT